MGYLSTRKEILIRQRLFSLSGQLFQPTLPREIPEVLGEPLRCQCSLTHSVVPLTWGKVFFLLGSCFLPQPLSTGQSTSCPLSVEVRQPLLVALWMESKMIPPLARIWSHPRHRRVGSYALPHSLHGHLLRATQSPVDFSATKSTNSRGHARALKKLG